MNRNRQNFDQSWKHSKMMFHEDCYNTPAMRFHFLPSEKEQFCRCTCNIIVPTIIASQGMVPLEPLYDTNEWQFD